MVGDLKVWRRNEYINEAKSIIDMLPIESTAEMRCGEDSEEVCQQSQPEMVLQYTGALCAPGVNGQ